MRRLSTLLIMVVTTCLALVATIQGAGASGTSSPASWLQFRVNNQHTGFNAHESTIGRSNVASLRLLWSRPFPLGVSQPVVSGGRIFVSAVTWLADDYSDETDAYYALSETTGSVVWSKTVHCAPVSRWASAGVDVADGLVVFPTFVGCGSVTGEGSLRALRARTGAAAWAVLSTQSAPTPAIARGNVFAALNENVDQAALYSLDGTDGSVNWSTSATDTMLFGNDTPTVAWPYVFLNSGDVLRAFDATTGIPLWSVPARTYAFHIKAVPAVANGIVYVPCPAGLCAYSVSTHASLWSATGAGQTPAIAGGRAFAACAWDGSAFLGVCAYDATTGSLLWRRRTRAGVSAPSVANGVVYVGTSWGNVRAFATDTGTSLATIAIAPGSALDFPPIVVNGRLLVAAKTAFKSFGLPS